MWRFGKKGGKCLQTTEVEIIWEFCGLFVIWVLGFVVSVV